MKRIAFLVDGFNLYHSLVDAARDLHVAGRPAQTKWLDLRGMLSSYLHIFGRDASVSKIVYFSALANWRDNQDPGCTARHLAYIECLKSTGIDVKLGRFKERSKWCSTCQKEIAYHEEKETDVAICAHFLEILSCGETEVAVLVTGDTDLSPAIRTAHRLYPGVNLAVGFPHKRKRKELAKLADQNFLIKPERYTQHQFPDRVEVSPGRVIIKPSVW